MNYNLYKVKTTHSDASSTEILFRKAASDSDVISELRHAGFKEPIQIRKLKFIQPTEKQIEYAKTLKIALTEIMTKQDVSALISRQIDNDSIAEQQLIDYATTLGLNVSEFIGEKAIYNLIFEKSILRDKIAFFVFCVYKQLSSDTNSNLNRCKYRTDIYDFVDIYLKDEKFVKSVCKYEGRLLIHFGEKEHSDGLIENGGSINTYGYKTVSNFISSKFATNKTKKLYDNNKQSINVDKRKGSGCVTPVVFILLVIALLTLTIF